MVRWRFWPTMPASKSAADLRPMMMAVAASNTPKASPARDSAAAAPAPRGSTGGSGCKSSR